MSTLAVEIHDAGILVSGDGHPAAPLPPPSPGYALVEGGRAITGAEAAAVARLKPKQINSRFWSEVDASLPPGSAPDSLSNADLAHAHLAAIWEKVRQTGVGGSGGGDAEVLLVIPGSYSDPQLGLILGIARACGMPVTGMVDAALAAALGSLEAGEESPVPAFSEKHLLHLDLQLHTTVLTEMSRSDEVVRHRVEVLRPPGLESLRETWVRRIATAFVRQTRFDPLHAGETEQRLYSSLPGFMHELSGADTAVLQIEAGQKAYSVTLARAEIADAVDADYRRIAHLVGTLKRAGERTALLLSHRAAALPGLRERLAEVAETRIVSLPEGVTAAGALRMRDRIRSQGESLPFITRLPAGAAPPAVGPLSAVTSAPAAGSPAAAGRPQAPADSADRSGSQPTHVLHAGHAYPITAEPFVLGIAIPVGRRGINLRGQTAGISRAHCSIRRDGNRVIVEDHSTHGSFLNGQRLDGRTELAAGDRLRLGSPGVELLLIHVEDEGGVGEGRGLS